MQIFILKKDEYFIKEAFLEGGFKLWTLIKLNWYRLYLQVITLSNITDGLGDKLCKKAYYSQRDTWRESSYDQLVQSNSNLKYWVLQ